MYIYIYLILKNKLYARFKLLKHFLKVLKYLTFKQFFILFHIKFFRYFVFYVNNYLIFLWFNTLNCLSISFYIDKKVYKE